MLAEIHVVLQPSLNENEYYILIPDAVSEHLSLVSNYVSTLANMMYLVCCGVNVWH